MRWLLADAVAWFGSGGAAQGVRFGPRSNSSKAVWC
jgi:hypothetical protein